MLSDLTCYKIITIQVCFLIVSKYVNRSSFSGGLRMQLLFTQFQGEIMEDTASVLFTACRSTIKLREIMFFSFSIFPWYGTTEEFD